MRDIIAQYRRRGKSETQSRRLDTRRLIFVYSWRGQDVTSIMNREKLNTGQKALQINLDAKKYGTFAEIGAGQEVARWFFHVGKASGTVAKTISAYDMAVSDAIYGAVRPLRQPQAPAGHARSGIRPAAQAARQDARRQMHLFCFCRHRHHQAGRQARRGRRPRLARHQISSPSARRAFHHHHPCADCSTRKRPASRKPSASSASTSSTARFTSTPTRQA